MKTTRRSFLSGILTAVSIPALLTKVEKPTGPIKHQEFSNGFKVAITSDYRWVRPDQLLKYQALGYSKIVGETELKNSNGHADLLLIRK